MKLPIINIASILPAILLSLVGVFIMVADPFITNSKKHKLAWLGIGGVLIATLSLLMMASNQGLWYADLWLVDEITLFFSATFLLIAGITILASIDFLRREDVPVSEYISLVLFATTGMLLMAGANELMMVFIALEILSIATYVLAGYRRNDLRCNEASMKYFLLGSFASVFFLYGVAMIFGATGSTNLASIGSAIENGTAEMNLVYLSAALILIALSFKIAMAPFHIWTPDVYEGAPTPVTGFMSVGPKAAGFVVLLRIFLTAFPDDAIRDRWLLAIWLAAALTMVVGNIVAVSQINIKRMLAYSSIAHAGYIAVALATGTKLGVTAGLFYVLVYSIMNLGAFAIVTALAADQDRLVKLEDYAGLASRRPILAALLSLFLLSLAGIPGTAGFVGKFFIFRSAMEAGLVGLTVLGVLTTVVSFYYYLYVIVQMYMREGQRDFAEVHVTLALGSALIITAGLTLYLGIFPSRLLEWVTTSAANTFFLLY